MTEHLLIETNNQVALLTLNRPERRNALDSSLLEMLRATMLELDADPEIGAVVLTGQGTAFCAGLDLDQLSTNGDNMINAGDLDGLGPVPPMHTPLIAAVNGPAITGGLELVLLCDLAVASVDAKFADTHARLGLLPDWGSTALLPQAVGFRKATQMLLTSDFIDASEALRYGLVSDVVPREDLIPTAMQMARTIATNDRAATTELLDILKRNRLTTVGDGIALEAARSRAWQGDGIDTSVIEQRREGIEARGRDQLQV